MTLGQEPPAPPVPPQERVRQLEEMQPRMLELEERVDFAERIVAKGREADRLQG